jgi:hypothetical protein
MPRRLTVEFTPVLGWGSQLGWVNVRLIGAVPGMTINNRVPLFRGPAGLTFGSPLVPGDLPASRYSLVTFSTDRNRQRFLAQLDEALRVAYPELFAAEAGV